MQARLGGDKNAARASGAMAEDDIVGVVITQAVDQPLPGSAAIGGTKGAVYLNRDPDRVRIGRVKLDGSHARGVNKPAFGRDIQITALPVATVIFRHKDFPGPGAANNESGIGRATGHLMDLQIIHRRWNVIPALRFMPPAIKALIGAGQKFPGSVGVIRHRPAPGLIIKAPGRGRRPVPA